MKNKAAIEISDRLLLNLEVAARCEPYDPALSALAVIVVGKIKGWDESTILFHMPTTYQNDYKSTTQSPLDDIIEILKENQRYLPAPQPKGE